MEVSRLNVKYSQKFLQLLVKCRRCKDLLHPPIYVCADLHIACLGCHHPYEGCPYKPCKRKFGKSNLVEKLSWCLLYPCYKGCDGTFLPFIDLDDHELICKPGAVYPPYVFPKVRVLPSGVVEKIYDDRPSAGTAAPIKEPSSDEGPSIPKKMPRLEVSFDEDLPSIEEETDDDEEEEEEEESKVDEELSIIVEEQRADEEIVIIEEEIRTDEEITSISEYSTIIVDHPGFDTDTESSTGTDTTVVTQISVDRDSTPTPDDYEGSSIDIEHCLAQLSKLDEPQNFDKALDPDEETLI